MGEGAHGPAVACDVVQEEQEYVLVLGEAEQPCADREFGGQVEAVASRLREFCLQVVLRVVKVDDGAFGLCLVGWEYVLVCVVSVFLSVEGAEGFVAGGEVVECVGEGVVVEGAGEAECGGDVVGGGGSFELVEEPQALLGVGEGDVFGPLTGG